MIHALLITFASTPLAQSGGQDLSIEATTSLPLAAAEPATPSAQVGSADEGAFLELGGGFVTTTSSDGPGEEVDFDEGFAGFVGVGRRYAGAPDGLGFDLMLEGFVTDQDAEANGPVVDVTAAGAIVSGVFDLAVTDSVSIYAGPGIGVAWLDVGTESDSVSDFDEDEGALLTWQARAGARFRLADRTSAFVGYRFLNIDDAEIDDDLGSASFDLQTQQHVLEAGLRFGPAGG